MTAGKTFRINGVLTTSGGSDMDSTTASQWFINHQGTESIASGTTVADSGCDGMSTQITATSATDGSNNGTCWLFAAQNVSEARIKGNTRIKGTTRIK